MSSYLIVGGSGDIAVTAKKLLEQGLAVTCLARDESRVEELKSLGAKVVIRIANKESVSSAIELASQQGDGKIWCSPLGGFYLNQAASCTCS